MAKIASLLCITSAIMALIFNALFLETAYILIIKIITYNKYKKHQNAPENIKLLDVGEITEKVELQRDISIKQHKQNVSNTATIQDLNQEDLKVNIN